MLAADRATGHDVVQFLHILAGTVRVAMNGWVVLTVMVLVMLSPMVGTPGS